MSSHLGRHAPAERKRAVLRELAPDNPRRQSRGRACLAKAKETTSTWTASSSSFHLFGLRGQRTWREVLGNELS
jgi:hypothetical protein